MGFALRLAATAFTTAVILIARPGDDWWVTNAAGALDTRWAAGIPLVAAAADAASSHWTEFRRIGTLGALFVLGGAAYLGVLYGFGFRLRDVKQLASCAASPQVPPGGRTATFFASVFERSPFARTTVMVTAPVLLVLRSRTVPALRLWVPPITTQWSPSLEYGWSWPQDSLRAGRFGASNRRQRAICSTWSTSSKP